MRLAIPGVPDLSAQARAGLEQLESNMGSVLAHAGFQAIVPPILELAEPFIETSGEDIRRRLYSFNDPAGIEYCLRPDLTIPTCRWFLRQNEHPRAEARLSALGPAFRHQVPGSIRPRQFQQMGAELINALDPIVADAEMLGLAVACLEAGGIKAAPIRLGDLGLFADLMRALDLSARVQARLRRALGMPQAMDALLDNDGADRPSYSSLAQTLSGLEPSRARALVDEILGLSGIQPVGGRGVDEIVDRLMAKAADQSGPIIGKTAAQIIRRYLALAGSLDDVMPALETLALPLNLDLGPFKKRLDLISARGISRDQISFAAHFSRSIDYYTGVVFEIGEPGDPATGPGPLAAGGRYDGLLARLGADYDMPAIGFALWPERILAAAPKGPQS